MLIIYTVKEEGRVYMNDLVLLSHHSKFLGNKFLCRLWN